MSFSYWEQNTFIKSPDVVIIGSGIVGLNAAIALKKKSPSLHVIVLERGMFPFGASSRNAGFACFGSMSELLSDLRTDSEENVFELVEKRWNGLHQLRSLIGDKKLQYEPLGGFEIFTNDDLQLYDECESNIGRFNKVFSKITGNANIYKRADNKINTFGLQKVNHLIENSGEGQIDTGQMMKELIAIARSLNVELLNGANVNEIKNENNEIQIRLSDLNEQSNQLISTRRVIVCVNGFAKKFFPSMDVSPARAQVLVTSPIENLKAKGSFHYDSGYYYFRNVGNRILLGGGRNLDPVGETTEDMLITPLIQKKLERMLQEMIIPNEKYTIEMRWSGIMGLGLEKKPIVRQIDKNIYCAVRLGGMGVAIGTLTGNEVAEMVYMSL